MEVLRAAAEKVMADEAFKADLIGRGFDLYNVKPADFKAEAEAMSVTNSAIVTEFGLSAN